MTTYKTQIPLGSISTGTLRMEDLIPAYCDWLGTWLHQAKHSWCKPEDFSYCALVEDVSNMLEVIGKRQLHADYWQTQEPEYDLQELTEQLEEMAPDFCHFGAHEGDGSDFGFWIDWEGIESAKHDGEIVSGEDTPDWPMADGEASYFLHVKDHGNTTLYTRQGQEIWSVV